jgi:ammonium transporter Rh
MYWPSFNGALLSGLEKERTVINTVLAICASVMGAVGVSRIIHNKLEMEIILNATLAGGVSIGSSADLIAEPYAAYLIGFIGGAISALGFAKFGPFMAKKLNYQDTCGAVWLHGLPGIYSSIASAIVIASAANKGFPEGYFDKDATLGEIAVYQIISLIVTIVIALVSGASGACLATAITASPVQELFMDHEHFVDVAYPAEYQVGEKDRDRGSFN